MRKLLSVIQIIFISAIVSAQQLEIHHINVGDGDATVIAIKDKNGKYGRKILIDGGRANGNDHLVPYINKVFGNAHFTYVILSHFHDDHYNGLLQLKEGTITADTLIDPGGYTLKETEPVTSVSLSKINPPNKKINEGDWMKFAPSWQKAVKLYLVNSNPGFARSKVLSDFPNDIGNTAILGSIGGVPVRLTCVAALGYTMRENGETDDDNATKKDNCNNTSLAFVLQFGTFRYFTGGDLAGKKTSAYVDQETPLCEGLKYLYPQARSWKKTENAAGHICVFKAGHHGSDHSSNTLFLATMRPAVCITSAGTNQSWHLPSTGFLRRLAATNPLSVHNASGKFNQGFYFTTLMNFEGAKNQSLTEAENLFDNRPYTDFKYSHVDSSSWNSYAVIIKSKDIKKESEFRVYEVSPHGKQKQSGKFECHKF
jgi:beta-lactamase superfamily II metal-dependent hydrolase